MKKFETYYLGYINILIAIILLVPKFSAIGIAILAIIVIVGLIRKEFTFKLNLMNVLFILFYLFYLFYTLFTRDSELANKYLEYKLSFAIFPILFSFSLKNGISFKTPAITFVLSVLMLGFLGLINSAQCYFKVHEETCWVTGVFSYIHHPSYASIYFSIALLCVCYLHRIAFLRLRTSYILSTLFIIFIFLSLSLAGIIFLLFMIVYFALIIVNRRFGKIAAFISAIILPLLLVTIITFEPHVKWEFIDAKDKMMTYIENPEAFLQENANENYSGSNSRLILWTVTMQGVKEYPLGIGTGNVDGFLQKKLQNIGLNDLAEQNLNPHNQYLQTWLEIGFFGFIVLLIIVFYPLIVGILNKNNFLIVFSLCLMFNLLFESILQRQSGIVFFSFAFCFVMRYHKTNRRLRNINKQ